MPADLCLIYLAELVSGIIIIHLSLRAVHTPIQFLSAVFQNKRDNLLQWEDSSKYSDLSCQEKWNIISRSAKIHSYYLR
jgi:hypothetical protein